jgi:hypothetical protein
MTKQGMLWLWLPLVRLGLRTCWLGVDGLPWDRSYHEPRPADLKPAKCGELVEKTVNERRTVMRMSSVPSLKSKSAGGTEN